MTIMLSDPSKFLNVSVNPDSTQTQTGPLPNILDELNDDEHHNGNNLSVFNMTAAGNDSLMNASSNRGINTTMNFIKSTCVLIQCRGRLSKRRRKRIWGLIRIARMSTIVLSLIFYSRTRSRK